MLLLQRVRVRAAALLMVAAVLLGVPASPAGAQYFGQNKVNYQTFDFRILRSPTFDTYYYAAESTATVDAARMAERWYARLSPFIRHKLTRKSLIFFADQADFQQNNVAYIGGEGTGGVTEGARQRVVMPFTGIYGDFHHVLGHEIVHVFQYDIANTAQAQGGQGGGPGLNALPLWLVEGMAEYLSLGRADVNTATWLRDAARRNDIPTIKQLTTDPRYFPYRYGQALWAYVGGRYGDQAVVDVFRSALRYGFEGAIRRVLDVSTDQFSKDWAASIKNAYLPLIADRTSPESTATPVVLQRNKRGGEYNTSPVISPDGRYMAFFSSRGLFGVDIYIADAVTGRVIKSLGSINTPRHYDALSFINSAGTWSPDGNRLAYVIYREGNQELQVYDVARRRTVRTLRTRGQVGAALDPAWSPDGRTIAFSGNRGGISDLYLYDVETEAVTQLTNDRYAQIQPQWSPDGRTLVYATDESPATSFERMTFGPMRIATLDVASRQRTLVDGFPNARHINPYYSPDGRSLYFVADPDGFSDIYRLNLADNALARLTRVSTGISGITNNSPAISVARTDGRLVFSIFSRGGYNIARIDQPQTVGTPVTRDIGRGPFAAAAEIAAGVTPKPDSASPSGSALALGGVLPPVPPERPSVIERYLADAETGLPEDTNYATVPVKTRLSLDYIAPPTVGVGYNQQFGSMVGGGVAAFFSDQLGNQSLATVLQANGQIQDIGGQALYVNSKNRWNWGATGGRIPFLTGFAAYGQNAQGQTTYNQVLQRVAINQVAGFTQYPLNPSQRFEFTAGYTQQSFNVQIQEYTLNGAGQVVDQRRYRGPSPPGLGFGNLSAAFVGDYSVFGFTSPIAGGRYRFEVTPNVGDIRFTTALADYRRYFLARPVTFAVRGTHYGRYGSGADDNTRLNPLYSGFAMLVRGYDVWNDINPNTECGTGTGGSCPIFDRMFGSRYAAANAEVRLQLFGTEAFGVFRTSIAPVEIAPFFDAAVTWNGTQNPNLRWVSGDAARTTLERVPVFSTGVTARINLLGFAVVEAFYAYPFQRPDRGGRWGFQLAPGW